MQQVYRRKPMSKCNFNKVALQIANMTNLSKKTFKVYTHNDGNILQDILSVFTSYYPLHHRFIHQFSNTRSSHRWCSIEICVLKILQNSQENTFFTEHLWTTASVTYKRAWNLLVQKEPPEVF